MNEKTIVGLLEKTTDLNTRDIKHLSGLIAENLPFDRIKHVTKAWAVPETVVAAAYLYSKCPGNSDNVIDYRLANATLKDMHEKSKLMRGVKKVKELGFIPQFCVVTSTVILRNMKRDNDIPYFTPTFDKAIEYSEHDAVRKNRQGKSPVAVAAGCFYIAGIMVDRKLTQKMVSDMFGVVEVTVRTRYQAIVKEVAPEMGMLWTTKHKDPSPRVQCKNCVNLGAKLPKRPIINRMWPGDPVYRSPGWECLGDGMVFNYTVPSVTYERICHKYKPNNETIHKRDGT